MADPTRPKTGRLIFLKRLPYAVMQAFFMLVLCAIWMAAFAWFWTFMVIELPKDLGPYSQMSSLSMFLNHAFPMRDTNDTAFEYKFDHVLMLACVMVVLMMGWAPTRYELRKGDEKAAKKKKKSK